MDERKKCTYAEDFKRCPAVQRHFICNTVLYKHCGYFHVLYKQDIYREQSYKTIENLTEEKK